jgi:hypothetical protein
MEALQFDLRVGSNEPNPEQINEHPMRLSNVKLQTQKSHLVFEITELIASFNLAIICNSLNILLLRIHSCTVDFLSIMYFSSIVFLRDCGELSCSTYKDSCLNGSVAEKLNEFYSRSKILFLTVEAKMSTIVPLTSAPGVTTIWEAFAETNNNLACWGYTPTIVGMPGSDNSVGTPGQDIVVTLGGGDDSVRAQGGDYFIYGGPGNDNLRGGDSDDTVGGYSGDDNIFGGAGYDLLTSNDGDDKLWAAMMMTTCMMVQISTMVMEDRAPISAMMSRL